jgi:hypothetical protein
MKGWVKRIFNYEDFKEASLNFVLVWLIGQIANIVSQKFFGFPLNQFNSIVHLAIGVGLGTYAYRRMGGGVKGIFVAFILASLFNGGWEGVEFLGKIFSEPEMLIDTLTDIGFVYFGALVLAPLVERMKKWKKKGKRKKKGKGKTSR